MSHSARAFNQPTSGNALGKALAAVVAYRYDQMTEHRELSRSLPLRDFNPTEIATSDNLDDLPLLPESGEFQQAMVSTTEGTQAQLHTYARRILVSREVIVNDDVGLITKLFGNLGTAVGRVEARLVYELLEANKTLSDGEPMFHSTHGNIVASALDASSLGEAMGAMRDQKTPAGTQANFRAKFLVTAPGLEYAALKLVADAGADLRVIAAPWLAAGRWYLMADPEQAPVIGRLFLEGNERKTAPPTSPPRPRVARSMAWPSRYAPIRA